MSITSNKIQELVQKFGKNDKDTGVNEVQCAILTTRILSLTEYCKNYRKDFVAKRTLLRIVAKRRRLLIYLKSQGVDRYKNVLSALSLRK